MTVVPSTLTEYRVKGSKVADAAAAAVDAAIVSVDAMGVTHLSLSPSAFLSPIPKFFDGVSAAFYLLQISSQYKPEKGAVYKELMRKRKISLVRYFVYMHNKKTKGIIDDRTEREIRDLFNEELHGFLNAFEIAFNISISFEDSTSPDREELKKELKDNLVKSLFSIIYFCNQWMISLNDFWNQLKLIAPSSVESLFTSLHLEERHPFFQGWENHQVLDFLNILNSITCRTTEGIETFIAEANMIFTDIEHNYGNICEIVHRNDRGELSIEDFYENIEMISKYLLRLQSLKRWMEGSITKIKENLHFRLYLILALLIEPSEIKMCIEGERVFSLNTINKRIQDFLIDFEARHSFEELSVAIVSKRPFKLDSLKKSKELFDIISMISDSFCIPFSYFFANILKIFNRFHKVCTICGQLTLEAASTRQSLFVEEEKEDPSILLKEEEEEFSVTYDARDIAQFFPDKLQQDATSILNLFTLSMEDGRNFPLNMLQVFCLTNVFFEKLLNSLIKNKTSRSHNLLSMLAACGFNEANPPSTKALRILQFFTRFEIILRNPSKFLEKEDPSPSELFIIKCYRYISGDRSDIDKLRSVFYQNTTDSITVSFELLSMFFPGNTNYTRGKEMVAPFFKKFTGLKTSEGEGSGIEISKILIPHKEMLLSLQSMHRENFFLNSENQDLCFLLIRLSNALPREYFRDMIGYQFSEVVQLIGIYVESLLYYKLHLQGKWIDSSIIKHDLKALIHHIGFPEGFFSREELEFLDTISLTRFEARYEESESSKKSVVELKKARKTASKPSKSGKTRGKSGIVLSKDSREVMANIDQNLELFKVLCDKIIIFS